MFRLCDDLFCLVAIYFLSTFLISDSFGRKPSRIIGGKDAAPGEFPWQVSVRIYDKHICGGAIIGKRHILTAGHCIINQTEAPYSEMTIVTGSNILEPGTGKSYRVKTIKVHEKFSPRTNTRAIKNDIAVIALRKEIEVNEFQGPIFLPRNHVVNGVKGVVTGFGRIGNSVNERAKVLQKLEVAVINSDDCFARGVRVQNHQICAIKLSGHCTAKGDSGSPLIYNNEIVGIVSTSALCSLGIPDVYTKVYSFIDFIKSAIAHT